MDPTPVRPARDRLRTRLERGGPLRLDGGLATTLEAAGADLSSALWSARLLIDDPEAIVAAHQAFHAAGAEVLLTASYQLSAESLRRAGHHPGTEAELLRHSVELARLAAGDTAAVAGSLGPWGAVLGGGEEYTGGYGVGVADLARFHASRIAALLDAGVDALAFETVPSATELRAIASLVDGIDVPVWVSVTTDATGTATPEGTPLLAAFAPLLACDEVIAVGVNCVPPERVVPALGALAGADRPLLAEPNAGDRYVAGSGWVPARPVRTAGGTAAERAATWVAAGARLVGGCCGTSPDALRALLAPLHAERRPPAG